MAEGSFWQANLLALKAHQPGVDAAPLEAAGPVQGDLSAQPTRSGQPTVRLGGAKGGFYLHSAFDPVAEAARFAQSLEDADSLRVVLVYGFGLGYHLEALLAAWPRLRVVAVQAHMPLLGLALGARDLTGLLGHPRFTLLAGEAPALLPQLARWLGELPANDKDHLRVWPHPPSLRATPPQAREVRQLFEHLAHLHASARRLPFEKEYLAHRAVNVTHPQGPSRPLCALYDRFEGFPAILAGAGPSLDANAPLLGEVGERGLLACVDVAARALARHGVSPHLVFTLDPMIRPDFFAGVDPDHCLLVHSLGTSPQVVGLFGQERRFCAVRHEDLALPELTGFGPQDVAQGFPSVFLMAVELLWRLGVRHLTLVGSDLAVTPQHTHATGVQETGNTPTAWEDLWEVAGYHGGVARTTPAYYLYLRQLEAWLRQHPDLRVLNATQGGAAIAGTTPAPLQQVLTQVWPKA